MRRPKSDLAWLFIQSRDDVGDRVWQEIVKREEGPKNKSPQTGDAPHREMLSCQRRRSGFAFLMLTTRAGGGNSVGIGGRRW
jgi:hypothetical protein